MRAGDEHTFLSQVQEISAGGDAKAALRDMEERVSKLRTFSFLKNAF